MDDLILYAIIAGLGFVAGWYVRGAIILAYLSNDPDKMIKILEQIKFINEKEASVELPKDGTELNIERHGEVLYGFAANSDEFIAQGTNLAELLEIAHKRFPGRVFFGDIPTDNPAKEIA